MELSEHHSWEKDFGLVCLNIDIVSIFFPTSAEGREVSSACNICHSLLTACLCFSLYHHFGRNGEGTLVVLFLLVSQPGQLGSGKGTCLSVLSLLRPFFRTIIEIQRAIGWAGTPRLVASGGGRHRFRATGKDRAQFPGRNLGGFAKPSV